MPGSFSFNQTFSAATDGISDECNSAAINADFRATADCAFAHDGRWPRISVIFA